MTFFSHASLHLRIKQLYFKSLIPYSIKHADVVIADSDSTRREILRIVSVSPDKVVTIPLGADLRHFRPVGPQQVAEVRTRYRLESRYILTVGQLHPRKNLTAVVRALHELSLSGQKPTFVIAGARLWGAEELEAEIDRLSLRQQIRFLGRVPDDDLPALYSGAAAVVYPSFFEGFGLPVLEAMACGAACIVSDSSSLPEVGGDAVLQFDPRATHQLAEHIRRVLADGALAKDLGRRGRIRARSFSWDQTAQQTLAQYEHAHQIRGRSTRASVAR
jgi:glycosyltransferase involved in cell wall biosynthesis